MRLNASLSLLSLGLATAGLLAGCGGGGSSTPTTNVTGAVVKGPVSGAAVCAYKATAAGKGEQIKCTTSGAAGTYALDLEYAGDVVIEASGGSYTDEATNTTKTLSDPMQVVLASQGGAAVGVITPLTSVAYSVAKSGTGGVTSASFASAATSVAGQFQLANVNIATTTPVVTGAANGYGQILRGVSQYVANGQTLASFLAFASPATLQAAFNTAYTQATGLTANFTLGSATGTGGTGTGTGTGGTGTGTGTGGTGTGTGGTGTGTAGNKNLVVTVAVMGTTSTVNVGSQPAPTSEAEFCNGLTKDSTFSQITASGGGTMKINSCSFSGNVGKIDATLTITSPITLNTAYSITYTYN